MKYINAVFSWVSIVTRGQSKHEYDVKREQFEEIKKIYKFNFRYGINIKTIENPSHVESYSISKI